MARRKVPTLTVEAARQRLSWAWQSSTLFVCHAGHWELRARRVEQIDFP